MSARIIPVEPFDLVVFGGTGDLARRKLLPGLFHRDKDRQIPDQSRIVAVSRSEIGREGYLGEVEEALGRYVPEAERDPETLARFLRRLDHVALDAIGDDGWGDLKAKVEATPNTIRVFYLATSPGLFGPICERLQRHGLVTPEARVVIEKPIGRDLASAKAINGAVGGVFEEERIFRIDHYLGKESVQNLLALRFANSLFEPLWNANYIDHVQITVAENLGVEGRGGYYDASGALRDMLQNHIMQLMCLVAMEPPQELLADTLRDEKLKVLRALKPIRRDHDVGAKTVRGQYTAGAVDGQPVPGYLDEIQKNASPTETFCVLKAEVDNWRWAGVPFYLRTGKRLAERVSDIVVQFKAVPHSIFADASSQLVQNRLVVRLQPDEAVRLFLMTKEPGPGGMRLKNVPLNLAYSEAFTDRYHDAYERLLMDVVRGNPALFMRKDEVETAWTWIEPILEAWEARPEPPRTYVAGSWGPSAAIALIERDGRTWHEDAA